MNSFTHVCRLGTLALMLLLASACRPAEDTVSPPPAAAAGPTTEMASVMVDSVSYRHDRSMQYTLYDLSKQPPQAIGGEIVDRLASGGSKGCCIGLPTTWRPGLKVRVVWEEGDRERMYEEKHTRDLEIPKYDTPADLYVVFYPAHEVEVVVSRGEPGHELWAGRVKQTPWDACVAAHGRKPCFAALPKQFDTGSLQGYCPEAIKNNWPKAEESCEVAMRMCMTDYEDEKFCKEILWGEKKK